VNRLSSLPRIYQANLDRLFQRVILPLLEQLPLHGDLVTGEAPTMDAFLDRCAAQVDNHLANEAAKAFALTVAATFERQLHAYALELHGGNLTEQRGGPRRASADPNYEALLAICAEHAGVDLGESNLERPLRELLLVANVVRHGEGRSCDRLHDLAPRLWQADSQLIDLAPGPTLRSDRMRIVAEDIYDFAVATMVFWGHADPQVGAVTTPPGYPQIRRLGPASSAAATIG
jgi:hypothetical protein